MFKAKLLSSSVIEMLFCIILNFSALRDFAFTLNRYFRMGNYKHFLGTIAAEASHLQYCIIEPYIDEVFNQTISV